MRKIYNVVLAILFISVLNSCQDKLEQINPNVLTVDQFWKTEADFNAGLIAAYSGLQFPAISGTTQAFGVMRSDLCGTEDWYSVHLSASNMTWTNSTEYVEAFWSQPYIGIFRANQVLYYIDEPDAESIEGFTNDEKTSIKAQARFIRAFLYFELLKNFNGAVIQDQLAINEEDLRKPFSSRTEVLEQVIYPDLHYARQNLTDTWIGDDLGRATWGAATALLGKIYLHQGAWDSAAFYLNEVIQSGLYSLAEDQMDNFTEEGEFNSESIFEIGFTDQVNPGVAGDRHDDILANSGGEAQSIASPYAALYAGGYNTNLGTYWLQEMFTVADSIDRNNVHNQYVGGVYRPHLVAPDLRTRSNRTYASLAIEHGDGFYFEDSLSTGADGIVAKLNPNFGQGSKIKKYTSWYKAEREAASPENARTGINWRAIRLADVYLMYAEAVLNLNHPDAFQEALTYVDAIRERAGTFPLQSFISKGYIPKYDVSKFANSLSRYPRSVPSVEALLHHIQMVERPLELCFEGHRWNDLVRWGMVQEVFNDRREEELKLIALLGTSATDPTIPIPADGNPKRYPLYLNEHVRIDFQIPVQNYIPGDPNSAGQGHDYFPVPAIETEANDSF